MNAVNSVDTLNRLLVIHHRSLASYLSYASPTWHRGDDRARDVLQQIAADHQQVVDRLGEMIIENDGVVQFGGYPMRFTGYHDLGFEFLLDRLIESQKKDVAAIEECIGQLDPAPLAKALAQEALGAAKAHLESLEELKQASSVDA
jgi:hypothetical protein